MGTGEDRFLKLEIGWQYTQTHPPTQSSDIERFDRISRNKLSLKTTAKTKLLEVYGSALITKYGEGGIRTHG